MKRVVGIKTAVAVLLVAMTGKGVFGEAYTWTGQGADPGDWNASANWSPAGTPGAGDSATFGKPATITSGIAVGSGVLAIVANDVLVQLQGVVSGEGKMDFRSGGGNAEIVVSGANTYSGGTLVKEGSTTSHVTLANPTCFGTVRTVTCGNTRLIFDCAGATFAYDFVPEKNSSSFDLYFHASGTIDGDVGSSTWTPTMQITDNKRSDIDFVITGKVFGKPSAGYFSILPGPSSTSDCAIKILGGVTAWSIVRNATGQAYYSGTFGLGGESRLDEIGVANGNCKCLGANVLGNAALSFSDGFGTAGLDLAGKSQTAQCIKSTVQKNRKNKDLGVFSGDAATLQLALTANATCYEAVNGKVSIVVDATDSQYVQEFCGRESLTSGSLVASNGVLRIGTDASFANVAAIVASDGGVVEVTTAQSGALAGVQTVYVEAGGKVSLADTVAAPFLSGAADVVLERGAEFSLGADASFAVRSLTVNGTRLDPGDYGHETVPEITGTGRISVPLTPSPLSTGCWTGAGDSEKSTLSANWEGGYPGIIPITFATGGVRALLAAHLYPTELRLRTPDSIPEFAIETDESVASAAISLSGDLLMDDSAVDVSHTNTIAVPVVFAADAATVKVDGLKNTLVMSAPLRQSVSSMTLKRTGTGCLVLRGVTSSLAGSVYVNGGINEVAGGALGGTPAAPVYVEVNPNADALSSAIAFRFLGGIYNQSFQFIRNKANGLTVDFVAGSTNILNGSCNMRSNYGNSYRFEEDSVTVFNGGLAATWLYDYNKMHGLYGATVVITNAPLRVTAPDPFMAFVSYSSQAHDKRSQLRFSTTGNASCLHGIYFSGALDVVFDVDYAFDADGTGATTPLAFQAAPLSSEGGRFVRFDLNGHSQRFGRLIRVPDGAPFGWNGFWGDSDAEVTSATPAALHVVENGEEPSAPSRVRFVGAASLVKEGTNTLVFSGNSTTTGRLEVACGRLAFAGASAGFSAVSEVAVSGGVLVIDSRTRLPEVVGLVRHSGGLVDLAEGVRIKADTFQVSDGAGGWTSLAPGRYDSRNLPGCISGSGSIRVCGGGLTVIVR